MDIKIFAITCFIVVLINGMGWILYKNGKANSWENGIKELFHYVYVFFYEESTGKTYQPPEEIIDERRYLSGEELLALTQKLETVYEQIQLSDGIIHTNGISWYNYFAYKIASKYKNLSLDERKRLLASIIRKYFQEIHGINVDVYIRICSDYRLYFAIPLNEVGKNYLDAQEQQNFAANNTSLNNLSSKIIEEEIPEDSSNDFRL